MAAQNPQPTKPELTHYGPGYLCLIALVLGIACLVIVGEMTWEISTILVISIMAGLLQLGRNKENRESKNNK